MHNVHLTSMLYKHRSSPEDELTALEFKENGLKFMEQISLQILFDSFWNQNDWTVA